MTESSREGSSRGGNGQRIEISVPAVASRTGPPPVQAIGQARYCAECGAEVGQEGAPERFSEVFCSDAHAEEFVKGVRAARAQAAAAVQAREARPEQDPDSVAASPGQPNWKHLLKMAACCGAPLLALVILAGGGGALLGAAGAVLPWLAFLACPLGMFFMMRAMMKGHQPPRKDKEPDK